MNAFIHSFIYSFESFRFIHIISNFPVVSLLCRRRFYLLFYFVQLKYLVSYVIVVMDVDAYKHYTILPGQTPLIRTIPSDAIVTKGENIIIFCDSTSKSISVVLELNRVEVNPSTDTRFEAGVNDTLCNITLTFIQVTKNDQGAIFTCFNSAVSETSDEVILTVLCE